MMDGPDSTQGSGLEQPHQPVLYHEIILALRPHSSGRYVDATLGAGGHAWGILTHSQPHGRLLGLDLDPQALALARERLSPFGDSAILRQASYTTLSTQLRVLGWENVDGIVIDLGVSSMQLDTPERGFSFQSEGPLDMRFDPTHPLRAADLVNSWSERELADLLWRYGEEQQSRRIARAIVQARPLNTTQQLAEVVSKAVGGRKSRIHPATHTFQALRIAVNRELDAVEAFLPQAVAALASGGRLAVIAFHSLEDRIVKQYFRSESRDCICPPQLPICTCGHKASLVEINRRPLEASEEEMTTNPRARSARLRIIEKR
jgi:16S rRNA (cytosine1402-N4)-methyltransferase